MVSLGVRVQSLGWLSSDYYWIIGVLLASLASFISNLGLTLQKLQHRRLKLQGATPEEAARYHEHAVWRIGIGLVMFGSLADVTALSFSPQSLIAPLASLTLVSNCIFAPLLLNEKIGIREYVATLTILVGSVLSVVFAPHEDQAYTASQLFNAFIRPSFLWYFGATVFYCLCSHFFITKMAAVEIQAGTDSPFYTRHESILRVVYPSVAGVAGAQSVLFAKCVMELLADSSRDNPVYAHWQSYFVLAALALSVYLQIHWLNEGLRRFQIAFVVPVFTAFWIIISVTSGMIFYDEWKGMTRKTGWLFGLGVIITVAGVILLATRAYIRDGSEDGSAAHGAAVAAARAEKLRRDRDAQLRAESEAALHQQHLLFYNTTQATTTSSSTPAIVVAGDTIVPITSDGSKSKAGASSISTSRSASVSAKKKAPALAHPPPHHKGARGATAVATATGVRRAGGGEDVQVIVDDDSEGSEMDVDVEDEEEDESVANPLLGSSNSTRPVLPRPNAIH